MYMMPSCVAAGAAVALAAVYFSVPSVAESFRWGEGVAGSMPSTAPTSYVDRARKGDRLPVLTETTQPGASNSVETVELHEAGFVLRGRGGALLFRNDQEGAYTVAAKGVVFPEITLPGQTRDNYQREKPTTVVPAAAPATPSGSRQGNRGPAKLPVGCESPVSAMAKSTNLGGPGRCIARDLRQPSLLMASN